ncbi:MAG: hypothetical protein ABH884_01640 [Candidatus Komeilibacteria bacterium]
MSAIKSSETLIGHGVCLTKADEGGTFYDSLAARQGILRAIRVNRVESTMAFCHDGAKECRVPLGLDHNNPMIITIETAGHVIDKYFLAQKSKIWLEYLKIKAAREKMLLTVAGIKERLRSPVTVE